MQKQTVYLLQESKESNDLLARQFGESQEFMVVGSSTDGIKAITEVAERKPQIFITDLVLRGYDGLLVINKVRALSQEVKIIVLSALSCEEVVLQATEAGANYFMAKPYDFSVLKERLISIMEGRDRLSVGGETKGLHKISLEEKISKIFINVGIPPHIKGYSFLREGVKMAVEDPDVINNITKKLYPSIGEKYNTSASKVERAIRHAIEVAWNRGRIDNINNILGVRAFMGSEKPTNGEFIALVADKMLLEKA